MTEVLLAIHLMVAVALVLVILLQRSEGGGLGIGGGGGGGGMGGFMSARGTANLLTRATGLLAACFFVTSLSLAIIADSGRRGSIADEIRIDDAPQAPQVPAAPVSQ
jgi:preprotein translocase subunit SecG